MTSADTDALPALSSATAELERLARERGEETVAAAARELAHKIEQNHFYLVVVGQFKRGKTSLLNALAGEAILPVAVLPLTSVVTILPLRGFAKRLGSLRVRCSDLSRAGPACGLRYGEWESQEHKTGRPRRSPLPSPHLQAGLTLADTPDCQRLRPQHPSDVRVPAPYRCRGFCHLSRTALDGSRGRVPRGSPETGLQDIRGDEQGRSCGAEPTGGGDAVHEAISAGRSHRGEHSAASRCPPAWRLRQN